MIRPYIHFDIPYFTFSTPEIKLAAWSWGAMREFTAWDRILLFHCALPRLIIITVVGQKTCNEFRFHVMRQFFFHFNFYSDVGIFSSMQGIQLSYHPELTSFSIWSGSCVSAWSRSDFGTLGPCVSDSPLVRFLNISTATSSWWRRLCGRLG